MNRPWVCREVLYYKNTDPSIGCDEWRFDTEAEAKKQYESRKELYETDDESGWVKVNSITSNYFSMFHNEIADGYIVINYYCQGYNGANKSFIREE